MKRKRKLGRPKGFLKERNGWLCNDNLKWSEFDLKWRNKKRKKKKSKKRKTAHTQLIKHNLVNQNIYSKNCGWKIRKICAKKIRKEKNEIMNSWKRNKVLFLAHDK